ncbi:TolB family protein [Chloroflexota bacterium]
MYTRARVILILALCAWFCTACQPGTTASPASPTPVSESTAAPPPATEAVTEEVTEEASEPELSSVLPAPIYFLSGEDGNASLWRIEVDGATQSLIKDCCIRDYAVSPANGQIAYVTNDTRLIVGDGEEAIEIDLSEVSYPQEHDSALAWSPDGLQLALGGENGLWVYMLESQNLFQISGTAEYTTFIRPLAYDAWSPDSSKVLIQAYKPGADVDEIGMIPIVSGEVKMSNILAGRRTTWAPDSKSFYISSNFYGMMGILPSLIVVSADDMKPDALVKSSISEDKLARYLEGAQVGPDDLLYYFYGRGPVAREANGTGLSMYRSNRDGITDRVMLRPDTLFGISEILWAEDMSLAVVASAGDSPNNQTGVITILPVDGTIAAITTSFQGFGLQWGQAVE